MKRAIDVDPYRDDVTGVTRLRLTDNQSGTKMQTSPEALWDLLERIAEGEFDGEWVDGQVGSGDA